MDDHPDPETNPLRDRIARTLAEVARGEDAPEESVQMETPHWENEAHAVIASLYLDFTERAVRTPDGRHLETIYSVTGGWTEAGGEW